MTTSSPDYFARTASIISFLISVIALYYAWSISPYFHARPEHLKYWYKESNVLTETLLPLSAKLEVEVVNLSARPAKDVLVVVSPLTREAKIACNGNYKVLDGPKGSKLITIERIAPQGNVKVEIDEEVTQYPLDRSVFGDTKYRYCGRVDDVQTEFGTVRCDFHNYKAAIQRLPDDDRQPLRIASRMMQNEAALLFAKFHSNLVHTRRLSTANTDGLAAITYR